ncbi:MAG: PepSY domain-containing protein [Gammaproteobacteria bacterium]|nr:PepSY domain-containing protein [Gammaproteobacteria bacterium]
MKTTLLKFVPAALVLALSSNIYASDQADLDDIKDWKLVAIESCLDAALDTVPGHARKVELKMEGDDAVYEFDIETPDGTIYNVECNAEESFVTEIEREVAADDATFKKYAKITEAEARAVALDFNTGKVVSHEYELGTDGSVTYEYDIQTKLGYEIKVDVNAITGEIEEANIELYEIGMEKE